MPPRTFRLLVSGTFFRENHQIPEAGKSAKLTENFHIGESFSALIQQPAVRSRHRLTY